MSFYAILFKKIFSVGKVYGRLENILLEPFLTKLPYCSNEVNDSFAANGASTD